MGSANEPIVCTLTPSAARGQLAEWTDLKGHATDVVELADGVRMHLPAGLAEQVADLAARESSCCAFLEIASTIDEGELVLDITSANRDALPVIRRLAGIPAS